MPTELLVGLVALAGAIVRLFADARDRRLRRTGERRTRADDRPGDRA